METRQTNSSINMETQNLNVPQVQNVTMGNLTIVNNPSNLGFEQLEKHRRVILLSNSCLSTLSNVEMGSVKCMTFKLRSGTAPNVYALVLEISQYLRKVKVIHKVLYFPTRRELQIYCFDSSL